MTSDNEAHISFTFSLHLKTLQENLLKILMDSKTQSHCKGISKFFSNIEGDPFCECIYLRVYVNYKYVYACAYMMCLCTKMEMLCKLTDSIYRLNLF